MDGQLEIKFLNPRFEFTRSSIKELDSLMAEFGFQQVESRQRMVPTIPGRYLVSMYHPEASSGRGENLTPSEMVERISEVCVVSLGYGRIFPDKYEERYEEDQQYWVIHLWLCGKSRPHLITMETGLFGLVRVYDRLDVHVISMIEEAARRLHAYFSSPVTEGLVGGPDNERVWFRMAETGESFSIADSDEVWRKEIELHPDAVWKNQSG